MSPSTSSLTARNAIIAAAVILVVSCLVMWASMLLPQKAQSAAGDTFGTRANGYRALFELLDELGVAAERRTAPPTGDLPADGTYVLLAPLRRLVRVAPQHLQPVLEWVDQGGQLVVAPPVRQTSWMKELEAAEELKGAPVDVLDALGIADLLSLDERGGKEHESPLATPDPSPDGNSNSAHWVDKDSYDFLPEEIRRGLKGSAPKVHVWPIVASSRLGTGDGVERLALPAGDFAVLDGDDNDLEATLKVQAVDGDELLLAAAIRRGKGRIVVIAEPSLVANFFLPQADNSVVAARLLADGANPVIFDEFYHGLAVRGNPFYLLTYPSFAMIALVGLGGVTAWAWRSAAFLGPPLADREHSRRNIAEYIEAMARFFSHCDGSERFLIEEMRDGVLREFCRRFQLPLETVDSARIVAKLEKRDPRNAERLSKVLAEIENRLAAGVDYPKSHFLPDVQRLAACL